MMPQDDLDKDFKSTMDQFNRHFENEIKIARATIPDAQPTEELMNAVKLRAMLRLITELNVALTNLTKSKLSIS